MELVSTGSITIVDWNDISIADVAPASPKLGQLWFDASITPAALKKWDGSQWVSANVTPQEYADLLATVSGTENYRDTRPPTNSPSFIGDMSASAIFTTPADGSVYVKFQIGYTQAPSGLPADFLLVYVKEGGGTIAESDVCFTTNATSGYFQVVVKPSTTYSFGLQAVRNTSNAMLGTAIVQSGNIASPAGNYTGAINGASASSLISTINSAIKFKTNPFFEDATVGVGQVPALWNGFTSSNSTVTTNGLIGGKAVMVSGYAVISSSELIAVDTTREYKLRLRVRQAVKAGNPTIYAGVACYAVNGTTLLSPNSGTYHYSLCNAVALPPASGWTVYEARMTGSDSGASWTKFKTGTAYIKPLLLANYGSAGMGDVLEVDSFEFFDITETVWTNLPSRPTDAELLNSQQKWADVSGAGRPADYATKNMSWSQGTAPTSGMSSGDTWICTLPASGGDPNAGKLFTYNGVMWVEAADATQVIINKGIASAGRFEVGNAALGVCNAGINGAVTASPNTDIRFWAGSTWANAATAKFRVQNDGTLYATGANISGSLVLTSGATYDKINETSTLAGSISTSLTTTSIPLDAELFRFDSNTSGSKGTSSKASLSAFSRITGGSKFGDDCVLLEEGTTNLVPSTTATPSLLTGFSADPGSAITIDTQRLKCVTDGSGARGFYTGQGPINTTIPVTASTVYSGSVRISGSGTVNVNLTSYNASGTGITSKATAITLSETPTTVTVENFNVGAGAAYLRVVVRTSTAVAATFYVDNIQVEQKAYSTTFVNGTRASAKLVYPSYENRINWRKFSLIGWIKRKYIVSAWQMIMGTWTKFYFAIAPGSNRLRVSYFNSANTQISIETSSLTVADTNWHLVGFSFDADNNIVDFFVDGATEQVAIVDNTMTATAPTYFTLGQMQYNSAQYPGNMYMSNFAIRPNQLFTAVETSSYFAMGNPFIDSTASIDVPEPATVAAPTYA